MTKEEMTELKSVLRRAIEEEREMYNEHWLTEDSFLEQFGMFTKSWLKAYGHLLPRMKAEVRDEDGNSHGTRWAYARNKIQRMIQNGEIKRLNVKGPEDTAKLYGGVLVG